MQLARGGGSDALNEGQVSYPSTTILLVDEDVSTRNDGLLVPGDHAWTNDVFGQQNTQGANLVNADSSAKRYSQKVFTGAEFWRRFQVTRDTD